MHYSHTKLLLALFTAVLLTACNDSNNVNDNSSNGPLQQFAANTSDSQEILAPDELQQNITSLFGAADSEPVAVNSGDTVSSLIQR